MYQSYALQRDRKGTRLGLFKLDSARAQHNLSELKSEPRVKNGSEKGKTRG
jgi:hypothetical protein